MTESDYEWLTHEIIQVTLQGLIAPVFFHASTVLPLVYGSDYSFAWLSHPRQFHRIHSSFPRQVANRCCKGRVVSVLEGGYNLRGEHCSAFARSVASESLA